jgi:hypothetical protein
MRVPITDDDVMQYASAFWLVHCNFTQYTDDSGNLSSLSFQISAFIKNIFLHFLFQMGRGQLRNNKQMAQKNIPRNLDHRENYSLHYHLLGV